MFLITTLPYSWFTFSIANRTRLGVTLSASINIATLNRFFWNALSAWMTVRTFLTPKILFCNTFIAKNCFLFVLFLYVNPCICQVYFLRYFVRCKISISLIFFRFFQFFLVVAFIFLYWLIAFMRKITWFFILIEYIWGYLCRRQ